MRLLDDFISQIVQTSNYPGERIQPKISVADFSMNFPTSKKEFVIRGI